MECSDVCKAVRIRSVTNRETNSQRRHDFEIVNKKKRGSDMRVVIDFPSKEILGLEDITGKEIDLEAMMTVSIQGALIPSIGSCD